MAIQWGYIAIKTIIPNDKFYILNNLQTNN